MNDKTSQRIDILFYIILVVTGLYFFSFCSNDIILDDIEFIFGDRGLIHAPNLWAFWQGDSGFTRSWPISFAVLWILTKIFSLNFIYYKFFNVLLHLLNTFLLNRFVRSYTTKINTIFISIIFLLHPMQIEGIFWIFQIKTLLSTSFFFFSLFTLRHFYKTSNSNKYYFYSLILFYISLASKITAIFFPVFILLYFYRTDRKRVILSVPYLLLSAYVGLQTINGVSFSSVEQYYKDEVHLQQFETSQKFEPAFKNRLISDKINFLPDVENDRVAFKHLHTQLRVIGFISSFYIKQFFTISENSFFYKNNYFKTTEEKIAYFIAIIFFSTFIFLFRRDTLFFHLITLYGVLLLPVSGIIYVPYMKYSLVADHWFCLSLIPITLIFVFTLERLIKNAKIRFAMIVFISFYLVFVNFRYLSIFSSKEKLIEHSMKINKTETTLALELINDLHEKKDVKLQEKLRVLLKNTHYSNNMHFLDQISILASQLGFFDILEIVLFKKASIFLKDNEINSYLKTVEDLGRLNSNNTNFKMLQLMNHSEGLTKLSKKEIELIFTQ